MPPLVSFGLSARNAQSSIAATIESILQQSYKDWELIVIDDGSDDNTLSILKNLQDSRIQVLIDGEKRGLPIRLNQAVHLSRGSYFARIDADDIAYPDRLQKQVEFLEANPDVDLVGSWMLVFDQSGKALGIQTAPLEHTKICAQVRSGFPLAHPTWLGKRSWFLQHPYKVTALRCQDQDLLLRTYRDSKFACLPQILLGYRLERMSLKKSLLGRYYYSQALWSCAWKDQNPSLLWGIIEQIAKGGVDSLAMPTGFGQVLLSHRLGESVDRENQQIWQQVWKCCQSPISISR